MTVTESKLHSIVSPRNLKAPLEMYDHSETDFSSQVTADQLTPIRERCIQAILEIPLTEDTAVFYRGWFNVYVQFEDVVLWHRISRMYLVNPTHDQVLIFLSWWDTACHHCPDVALHPHGEPVVP